MTLATAPILKVKAADEAASLAPGYQRKIIVAAVIGNFSSSSTSRSIATSR